MGKRVKSKEKIVQRSIGFRLRQILFFDDYPWFKPDEYCRNVVDDQIKIIDSSYLEEVDYETEMREQDERT